MKTMTVGELKSHFSEVLDQVQQGEEIVISFGKKREKVAVLVPFARYAHPERALGLLQGKGSFSLKRGFKMSDEELLSS
jgi:prevent-host-death family protein